jgi:putative two-component system protein, hydrogenase maturation factor HypX/HoxX
MRPLRILFLTHAFNGLAQRLYVELAERGHTLSVEFDINDDVTREAVDDVRAPTWCSRPSSSGRFPRTCGGACPASWSIRASWATADPRRIDWAILGGEREWGVTLLQANAVMDAGDIWASATFPMRSRAEEQPVPRRGDRGGDPLRARGAATGRRRVVSRPRPLDPADPSVRGRLRPLARQARPGASTGRSHSTRRDSRPRPLGRRLRRGSWTRSWACPAGCTALGPNHGPARRTLPNRAACWRPVTAPSCAGRATAPSGSATCAQRRATPPLKLPATAVLGRSGWTGVPDWPVPLEASPEAGRLSGAALLRAWPGGLPRVRLPEWRHVHGPVRAPAGRAAGHPAVGPARVLVLLGGREFWSNGIHLGTIEGAAASCRRVLATISTRSTTFAWRSCLLRTASSWRRCAATVRAGGAFLALAADEVWAQGGGSAQPPLQEHGQPLRLGVLDLPVAAPRRRRGCGPRHGQPPADRHCGGLAQLGLVDAVLGAPRTDLLAVDRGPRAARWRPPTTSPRASPPAMPGREQEFASQASRPLPGRGAGAHALQFLRFRSRAITSPGTGSYTARRIPGRRATWPPTGASARTGSEA